MKYSISTLVILMGSVSASHGSIVISPAIDPSGSTTELTLLGSEGTPLNSARWYGIDEGDAVFTYWRNESIVFSADLAEDDWRVGLTARNNGVLPDSYTQFTVDIFVNDSFFSTVELPAIQDEYRTTWFDIGQRSGATDLKIVWKNDFWVPDVYDANIVIGAVQFGQVVPAAPTAGVFALAGLAAMRRRR
ncbi:MAG: hypothetical protein JKY43_05610 [Phycisphaerales bacterium]|nr:hypothetical protein [Phycisphaerales bacterium]